MSPQGSVSRALSSAALMLAEVESVDEAKHIRDKAEALRVYARQAGMGLETQNRCAELKLRAERKAGELLAADGFGAHGGDRRSSDAVSLEPFGIAPHQSSRWQRVASIPEPDFEAHIAEAFRESKELTTSATLKLAKRLTAADKPGPSGAGLGHDDAETATAFPTLVIDPPWRYDNVATRGAAEDHYPTMSQADLLALELPADDNAHLYLWVTNSFFEDGFALMRSWGFTYKTCLTWCKPRIGMGNYFRSTTEHVLFGVKGRQPTLRNDVPTHFVADRTRHSAKPESFYDLVESCSPGPFLEMFARRRRFGWSVWGNEA
jgi:N6-adenosine-specific RNA methylase IME4